MPSSARSAMTGRKLGLKPACAQACPTESIKFGTLDQLRIDAEERLHELQSRGMKTRNSTIRATPAWAASMRCSSCAATRGSIICHPIPRCPTNYLKAGWTGAAVAAGLLLFGSIFAFLGSGKR